MFGIGLGLEVGKYVWHNRGAIMRGYHHFVKHKVVLDDLLDLSEEHPDHPENVEKRTNKECENG